MKPTAAALAKAGEAYLGRPYSEMDCQAFAERCLKDVGISENLAGSNAWFRRMTWLGTPAECIARFGSIPVGAFLFIRLPDGKEPAKYRGDGFGNAAHMGLKTGRAARAVLEDALARAANDKERERLKQACAYGDGAIHSSASRGMVVTGEFLDRPVLGGWNRVGLWSALDYGPAINRMLGAEEPPDASEKEETMDYVPVTVVSDNGRPVKLRQGTQAGTKAYATWSEIPCGTVGVLLEQGPEWCRCKFGRRDGYMQTAFLVTESAGPAVPAAAPTGPVGSSAGTVGSPAGSVALTLTLEAAQARALLSACAALAKQLTARVGEE